MIKVTFNTADIDRLASDIKNFEKAIRKETIWTSAELSKQLREQIDSTVYRSYSPKVYKRSYALKRSVKADTKHTTYRMVRSVFIDDDMLKANNPEQSIPSRFGRTDWANPKEKAYGFFVHEGRGYGNLPPPPYTIRRKWRQEQPLHKQRRPFVENLYKALTNGDALLRRFGEVFRRSFRG